MGQKAEERAAAIETAPCRLEWQIIGSEKDD
jgi:hypothetical protein